MVASAPLGPSCHIGGADGLKHTPAFAGRWQPDASSALWDNIFEYIKID